MGMDRQELLMRGYVFGVLVVTLYYLDCHSLTIEDSSVRIPCFGEFLRVS
jgi:hypothetical protein